jgi:ABC-type spermidine/putrescine transport system permease subunit I
MVAEAPQRMSLASSFSGRLRRPAFLLSLPALVVLICVGLVPLVLIAFWSLWSFDQATYWIKPVLTLDSYRALLETGRLPVFARTLALAGLTALICTILAFPAATIIGMMSRPRRAALLIVLFTIPFFTSALIRSFAWRLVLGRTGIVNNLLVGLGMVEQPVEWLLFSDFAVVVGMVAAYLPFAVVPMVLVLGRIEPSVIRASQDLGAGFWTTLRRVVVPLAMPGVLAGFLFVFVVALGTSTEIQLLGGAGDSSIAIMINDVMRVVNFPLAFGIATVVVVLMSVLVIVADRLLKLSRMFGDLGT